MGLSLRCGGLVVNFTALYSAWLDLFSIDYLRSGVVYKFRSCVSVCLSVCLYTVSQKRGVEFLQ